MTRMPLGKSVVVVSISHSKTLKCFYYRATVSWLAPLLSRDMVAHLE